MKRRADAKRNPGQQTLPFKTRRGKRRGRKRAPHGRVAHRKRPPHKKRHPVHVTLRATDGLPTLRSESIEALVILVLWKQQRRKYTGGFQVVHYSIQRNHIHLIVEADDLLLRSGVSGFMISFAKRLNLMLGRAGNVWDDRYHRRDLTSPKQVLNALSYVLNNARKHGVVLERGQVDPFTTALRFDVWFEGVFFDDPRDRWPEVSPRTWLLAIGYRKAGLVDPDAVPGPH